MTDTSSPGGGPGWYADPGGAPLTRWWDGFQWTALTAPLPTSGVPLGAPGAPGAPGPPGAPGVAVATGSAAPPATALAPTGPTTTAGPTPTIGPLASPPRRRRWPFAVAGVVVLVLLAAVAGFAILDAADPAVDVATIGRERTTPRPAVTDPPPATTTTAATTTVPIAPPDDGPDLGSRENPAPQGQLIRLFDTAEGNFDVTLGQFTPDASALVAAFDPQNPTAPAGSRFAVVTLTATYHAGTERRTNTLFNSLDITLVGAGGRAVEDGGCAVGLPMELDQFVEIGDRSTISGNLCFLLTEADLAGPVLGRIDEAFCFTSCNSAWFVLR